MLHNDRAGSVQGSPLVVKYSGSRRHFHVCHLILLLTNFSIPPSFNKTRRFLTVIESELGQPIHIKLANSSLVLCLTPISTVNDELHKSVCTTAVGL